MEGVPPVVSLPASSEIPSLASCGPVYPVARTAVAETAGTTLENSCCIGPKTELERLGSDVGPDSERVAAARVPETLPSAAAKRDATGAERPLLERLPVLAFCAISD